MALRVVLADDAFLLREGISALLAESDEVSVVASVGDLGALLRAVDEHHPDVVITDIRMPPSGNDEGIQAANTLRETHPDVGVVVLSQYVEPRYAVRLLADGARGRAYLLKEHVGDLPTLLRAIREVAAGGSMTDPQVVDALLEGRARKHSPLDQLTPREAEVLAQIAEGKNNPAIARDLVITDRAVEKHINAIFAKLGLTEEPEVHRRVRAVLLFLDAQD